MQSKSAPTTDPGNDAFARFAPGLFVLIWATGFVVARLVAPHAEPFSFLVLRYCLAILVLAVVAVVVRAGWPKNGREWRDGLVAGALLHGMYLGAIFWAVHRGLPAGIAALIAGLQPLITGMLVGPLLGERVSARRWTGILVGFSGALMVVAPKLGMGGEAALLPLLVSFAGVVAITFGTIWQKRTSAALDLRTNAVVQYCGAALVTAPFALLFEDFEIAFVPEVLIGLGWAVFGLSIGAIFLLLGLIRRGAVAGVASLLFLVPPCSAVMAYFLFGETLTALQVAGMAVAALGVAIASRG